MRRTRLPEPANFFLIKRLNGEYESRRQAESPRGAARVPYAAISAAYRDSNFGGSLTASLP
jgi:hypothetical protein